MPHGARVEQTGWATGPDEPLLSELHPLHGWTDQDELRAPQGTAFTPWARVPRLTAHAHSTTLYAALATLTAQPQPEPLATAVTEVNADTDSIAVRWANDSSVTRIAFKPLSITHLP
jgi:hypothetical protein